MAGGFFDWFFRSRETGSVTIAQWPNPLLWIVIVAGVLLWIWPSAGKVSMALTIVLKAGLILWGADEILRGVNPLAALPRRRCRRL